MSKFDKPKYEVILFDTSDIIVTSGCEAGETPDQCMNVGAEGN